ncbi:MAG: LON peptidase substrate-binding domain-containing protein [Parvibaculum sp.]|uniref:LON peptidase substrate-binding domain-containing protein n=1 Tax=Parvibaculum sp. TaxID=2024848 RepID=UPI001D4CD135|nr:LON peptidase substrate-binding domain-containing protein [Parvibaculum sp.]MBX3489686.1 LON peptidase substrate-binding domain-containing protein [Parvibaculum sp.]MBX3494738.1 LON peptidase substrate-binding domain-containing protein [Parvibaculum sp.]MCW5726356.1 LON peptidase substrate-binding domain-containing protein [Parvibaculum sp.]
MSFTDRYRTTADLPGTIPVFPLAGAILLPRGQLPLNIFEPRYLKMIDDAIRGDRIVGMVQPDGDEAILASQIDGRKPPLCATGCAGRVTSFAETGDGRMVITLTGICRFVLGPELPAMTPYRQFEVDWDAFADDLTPGHGQDEVSRERLLEILKEYLDTHGLQADWRAIKLSSNETLVNSLCTISPYGPREKQALLEAKTLEDRNQMLIALTEQALRELSPGDATVQ